VLKELRVLHPDVELKFWCDVHFAAQAKTIVGAFDESIPVEVIASGKLRRYNHLTFTQHLLWPSLMWSNVVDSFKVMGGFLQSTWKLLLWRPDVIFTKGGFVCLPVGMAAKLLGIPLVIHDSDAHPGLTNRILSRWATKIATGAPLEYYSYPASRTTYVGIPVGERFRPFSPTEQAAAKKALGVDPKKPLLVVTGGGLGARRLNETTLAVLDQLQRYAAVILVSGAGHFDELRARFPKDTADFKLFKFVNTMHELLGAADVVVTRAGATTILELAALRKPTILVPNAALTGGHQIKNAAVYGEAQVAIVLDEDETVENPTLLVKAVAAYLNDPKTTQSMTERFGEFAKPHAAKDMAALIVSAI
jgi:UDP-N-acetylglucosamine--N-acetylmuramyl-(pentapeptide) pyrophosphoryl-undecaprenol N-acetylglucosamine transferase